MSKSLRLAEPAFRTAAPTLATKESSRLSSVSHRGGRELVLWRSTAAPSRSSDLRFPGLARFAKQQAALRRISVLPAQREFPMVIDFSQNDVRLPFGVPRFVNAATLRAMASGGAVAAQLLKKVGGA